MVKKILVVDDEKIGLSLVKFGLADKGYDIVTAMNGEDALNQVGLNKPDLIILDIKMPKMNGYEFIAECKKLLGSGLPPIIMLTAVETMEEIFKIEGVKGYFIKPVNLKVLADKIEACLSS